MITDEMVEDANQFTQEKLLMNWYDAELRRTMGIGLQEAQSANTDFDRNFNRWCERHSLKSKICVDWNYCVQLKKHASKVDMTVAMASFIASVISISAIGAVSAAVLIVRFGLHVTCECPE